MRVLVVTIAMLAMTLTLAWAEPEWKASLSLAQEFDDNTGEDHKSDDDFITSLRPALSYTHESSRLQFSSAYRGNYQYYARGTEGEKFNHDLNMKALLDAWDSLFFLEATEVYRLVNRDRTKGDVMEEDSTAGLVQQNTLTFSPYITPRFGNRTQAKIGYAFSNIWYDDDKDNHGRYFKNTNNKSKDIHRGFVDTTYDLTQRLAMLSGYSYTYEISDDDTLGRHIAYLGGSYKYAENSSLFLKIGPRYARYKERDESSQGLYWDAGLNHDFGVLLFGLTTGVSFEDDPDTGQTLERRSGTVRLTKKLERTVVSIFTSLEDYDESVSSGYYSRNAEKSSVRRTALGFNLAHELTARLKGTIGLTHDFENDSDDDTKRWIANLGLNYALSEKLDMGIWYRFKDSSSNDMKEDYRVHRAGVQLTWTF